MTECLLPKGVQSAVNSNDFFTGIGFPEGIACLGSRQLPDAFTWPVLGSLPSHPSLFKLVTPVAGPTAKIAIISGSIPRCRLS